MRILEQGPAVIIAAPATVVAEKIKANDTRFANRGGRMSGVHAAKGAARASRWTANVVGRGSRLACESLRNGTATPTKGLGGNYRAK